MIWPFGTRARLLRELDRLAFYNDKGIDYSRHNAAQVSAERAARIKNIETLVSAIGENHLPGPFLADLRSGALATDMTGGYIRLVKASFHSGSAP